MTDTTTMDATQDNVEKVFVNLGKNIYEKDGKNLISYKPTSKTGKTYPIGLGRFDKTIETWGDKQVNVNMYDDKYWLSVSVNSDQANNK